MIPIPKRPIPAKDMASKFYRMSKQSAIDEIEFRRKGSVDTEYWDEVMRHTMDYFQSVENSERDKDAYYRNALSSDDRFRAGRIIDDLVVDPAHAYREVRARIDNTKYGTRDRTFWMYIRRELNKRRAEQKAGGAL